jgi:hypothetical protein
MYPNTPPQAFTNAQALVKGPALELVCVSNNEPWGKSTNISVGTNTPQVSEHASANFTTAQALAKDLRWSWCVSTTVSLYATAKTSMLKPTRHMRRNTPPQTLPMLKHW